MRLPVVVLLGAWLMSCGGTAPGVRVTSPFTEEHAKFFEDGMDFVNDPSTLDGTWRDQWQADFDKRVELSDLIAHVEVETVRTAWDLDRRTLLLELSVLARMHGYAPAGTLSVSVHEGDEGYPSVKSAESRLLNAKFVLFVKWYANELDQPVPHWHMSPDTDAVMGEVAARVQLLHGGSTAAP